MSRTRPPRVAAWLAAGSCAKVCAATSAKTQKDGDAELTGWHGESSFRDGHEGFLGSASVIWSRRHPGGRNLVPRSPTLTVIEPNTSSECW